MHVMADCLLSSVDRVLIDLDQVDFITPDGIALLVLANQMAEERGKAVAVTRPRGFVRGLIDRWHLGAFMRVLEEYPETLSW